MQIRNTVTLIGNVGNRPDVTTLKNGNTMAKFSVATNEQWRDKDGNKQTRTEWHPIISFGKQADLIAELIDKGQQIAVVGTLRYNKWVDKHEQKRTSASIALREFSLLGTRPHPDTTNEETAERARPEKSRRYTRRSQPASLAAEPSRSGEDLPF